MNRYFINFSYKDSMGFKVTDYTILSLPEISKSLINKEIINSCNLKNVSLLVVNNIVKVD